MIGGGNDAAGGGAEPGRGGAFDGVFTDRGAETRSLDAASFSSVIAFAEPSARSSPDSAAFPAESFEDSGDLFLAGASELPSCFQSRFNFGIQEAICGTQYIIDPLSKHPKPKKKSNLHQPIRLQPRRILRESLCKTSSLATDCAARRHKMEKNACIQSFLAM
jgi:hypothetical protein